MAPESEKTHTLEKPSLKGYTIAVIGDLGEQYAASSPALSRWVKHYRGGKVAHDIGENVNVVLTTEEIYHKKKRGRDAKMMKAIQLANKNKLYILDYHWFECSCASKRILPRSDYDIHTPIQKWENDRTLRTNGLRMAKSGWYNTYLYHKYQYEYFPYEIILTKNLDDGTTRTYTLGLYESNATTVDGSPVDYQCAVRYSAKKGAKFKYANKTPGGGTYAQALNMFEEFFLEKTGIDWDRRMVAPPVPNKFTYLPPAQGKAYGEVRDALNHPKWVREKAKRDARKAAKLAATPKVGETMDEINSDNKTLAESPTPRNQLTIASPNNAEPIAIFVDKDCASPDADADELAEIDIAGSFTTAEFAPSTMQADEEMLDEETLLNKEYESLDEDTLLNKEYESLDEDALLNKEYESVDEDALLNKEYEMLDDGADEVVDLTMDDAADFDFDVAMSH